MSDRNILLWSSLVDTPRFISAGYELRTGTQMRSKTSTSVFKVNDNGSFQTFCSDVYSERTIPLLYMDYNVKGVYVRLDSMTACD